MLRSRAGLPWKLLPGIMALAWPTMLEEMMQTAVQYVDVAMVGTLGTQATAAVGATSTVNWLIGSTVSAVGVGFLAYISQACGAGDRQKVARASSQAMLVALVIGALFTVITLSLSQVIPVWMQVDPGIRELASKYFFIVYTPMIARAISIICGTILRAAGDTKTPMRIGVAVNFLNIVLNFLLIYPTRSIVVLGIGLTIPGAGLGVSGAAAASACSFLIGGIAIAIAVWKHPLLSPKGQSFLPDLSVLKPCMKVAMPNALQRFATSFGYVAFASMINALGDIATAAHTIANTVESAFYIPGYGMQTAAATIAGNAFGAQDGKRIQEAGRTIIFIEVVLMILSGGLLFLFAPNMMRLFTSDEQVITLGTTVLRMVAVSEPFFGISIVIEGMLHGMGKTVRTLVCDIFGMWAVRILGTWICTCLLDLGLEAAWGCMILHNLVLFSLYFVYYRSGRWNPLGKGSMGSGI